MQNLPSLQRREVLLAHLLRPLAGLRALPPDPSWDSLGPARGAPAPSPREGMSWCLGQETQWGTAPPSLLQGLLWPVHPLPLSLELKAAVQSLSRAFGVSLWLCARASIPRRAGRAWGFSRHVQNGLPGGLWVRTPSLGVPRQLGLTCCPFFPQTTGLQCAPL